MVGGGWKVLEGLMVFEGVGRLKGWKWLEGVGRCWKGLERVGRLEGVGRFECGN